MNQKFPKSEKLKSAKTIGNLFSEGKFYTKYPIKVFFIPEDALENNRAAFAVPKRNFKLAVDRNRLKRQLREVYRGNKRVLEEINGKKFVMLFLYLGKKKPQYAVLDKAMLKLLKNLRAEASHTKA
ncbi:ribonuclease P protein component [Aequorivita marina]|uniref:ribonuclease P protein component n=1 Tax=Aequorivita marina TaxID=3073654 RepID=UPI002875220B|nr:ribonuclease P protein component [Aequorivita sp. S2608]MDS1299699.1 ribonuclease P protein component [Aequorivita sp. S2608]